MLGEPLPTSRLLGDWQVRQPRRVRQASRTPRLELVHHFLRRAVRSDDEMNVVGSDIECVNVPSTDPAMVLDYLSDKNPLVLIEHYGGLSHPLLSHTDARLIRRLNARNSGLHPAALVTVQPRAVGRPGDVVSERVAGHG